MDYHQYGLLLILNSVIVVILQMPIMNLVSKLSRMQAILPLFLGMAIILCSSVFNITTIFGAIIWTAALSVIECSISYLDKLSQDDDSLLIKEASVGLGSALTVYFVRFFPSDVGAIYIGLLSIVLLFISVALFVSGKTFSQNAIERTITA